jgi:tricarballylate dehydrogenase
MCGDRSTARRGIGSGTGGGAKVLPWRNTRHTRNMRCVHETATETLTGPYTEEEFLDDLLRVTGGRTDEPLARMMIRESKDMLHWIVDQGVRFQSSLGGTLSLDRTNAFFLGGGRAMLNALYRTAEALGVEILYDAEVVDLEIEGRLFLSATAKRANESRRIRAASLVAAAGGFEANTDWLKKGWGEIAGNFLIRGTPYNRGTVLKMLIDAGVMSVGEPTQCHGLSLCCWQKALPASHCCACARRPQWALLSPSITARYSASF